MKVHLLLVCIILGLLAHDVIGDSWEIVGDAENSSVLKFIVAIRQQNVEELNHLFWEVASPSSSKYGKFLSADEVSMMVEPAEESIKEVLNWINDNGIEEVELTRSRDMMWISTTVETASKWLNTKFFTYKHSMSGRMLIKSEVTEYVIPQSLSQHIDFITGHTGFPLADQPIFSYSADAEVTPAVLRNRYNVTANLVGKASNNSLGVAEFQAQYYSSEDLQQFFQKEVPFAPTDDKVGHVVGKNDDNNPGIEANLDIQFIMGVAPGITSWFYSTPQVDFFTDMVNWLALLENATSVPLVISVSYGSQSQWPSQAIHDRVDIEFQKVGLRGVSIIFASGDFGTGCVLCTKFRPSWPASSMYVTSVGATQFIAGASGPEMAVSAFGSGGGFSSDDDQPDYQAAAVAQYFKVQTDLPDQYFYNSSGRGTPDVSALGWGFQVVVNGKVTSVGGTSASSPTFTAIIALLNDLRLSAGKQPLGFLNPWLYATQAANPTAFFDVTEGNNQHSCCGATGWKAAAGWDPVTGLGTPNYAVLSKLV